MANVSFFALADGRVWIVNYDIRRNHRVLVLRLTQTTSATIEEVMVPEAILTTMQQAGTLISITAADMPQAGGRVYVAAKTKWGA